MKRFNIGTATPGFASAALASSTFLLLAAAPLCTPQQFLYFLPDPQTHALPLAGNLSFTGVTNFRPCRASASSEPCSCTPDLFPLSTVGFGKDSAAAVLSNGFVGLSPFVGLSQNLPLMRWSIDTSGLSLPCRVSLAICSTRSSIAWRHSKHNMFPIKDKLTKLKITLQATLLCNHTLPVWTEWQGHHPYLISMMHRLEYKANKLPSESLWAWARNENSGTWLVRQREVGNFLHCKAAFQPWFKSSILKLSLQGSSVISSQQVVYTFSV